MVLRARCWLLQICHCLMITCPIQIIQLGDQWDKVSFLHLEDYVVDYNFPRSANLPPCSLETQPKPSAVNRAGEKAVSSPSMSTPVRKAEQVQSKDKLSLRELMENISATEREESAEIARLTSRLSLYEKRQQCRQDMLKCINAFLLEEEADNLSLQEADIASQKGALFITFPRLLHTLQRHQLIFQNLSLI